MPSVLIIDDDPDVCTLVERILTPAGFSVIVAATGSLASQRMEAALPDLVLLDRELPDSDGLNLLMRLRQEHPDVPVLILSADTSATTVLNARRLGATDYIAKPIDQTRLTHKVYRAWNIVQMERAMKVLHEHSDAQVERVANISLVRVRGPITEKTLRIAQPQVARAGARTWFVVDITAQPELDPVQLGMLERLLASLPTHSGLEAAVIVGRNYAALLGLGLDPESQLFLTIQDAQAYWDLNVPSTGRASG